MNDNGDRKKQIGSSGYYAQIGSSGYYAKIGSSGYYAQIGSTGEYSVIMCAGNESKAKAKVGSWITLAEWKWSDEKNVMFLYVLRLSTLMERISRLILGISLETESLLKLMSN